MKGGEFRWSLRAVVPSLVPCTAFCAASLTQPPPSSHSAMSSVSYLSPHWRMAPPHFLTLPLEVRKLVYLSLFEFHRAVLQVELDDENQSSLFSKAYFDYHPRSAQLFRVCSQLRHEAIPVFMQNTLVVAPRHSPLPFGFGPAHDTWLSSVQYHLRLRHLEYHITPSDAKEDSKLIYSGLLVSLETLRVVCSSIRWMQPAIGGSRFYDYDRTRDCLRNMMKGYLAASENFTYLAEETVAGRRICFYLCRGPMITKKAKARPRYHCY